jgi:hypothetical protein
MICLLAWNRIRDADCRMSVSAHTSATNVRAALSVVAFAVVSRSVSLLYRPFTVNLTFRQSQKQYSTRRVLFLIRKFYRLNTVQKHNRGG